VDRKAGGGAGPGRIGERVALILSTVMSSALCASLHLEATLFLTIFVLAALPC